MSLPVYWSSSSPAYRRVRAWMNAPPWLLVALSGGALGLSFPPAPLPSPGPLAPLAWIGLVPLLVRWADASSAGQMLAEAYACFGIACTIAFYWVLLHDISSAALASLGGLVLFPFLLAIPFSASVPSRKQWGRGPGFVALFAFYLTAEWAISHGPLAFPWPLLSHTQATLDPFRQLADLSGPSTLSAWILAINGCVFGAFIANQRRSRILSLLTAIVLIGGAALYGGYRMDAPSQPAGQTEALLIQPAIPALAWSDTADVARVDTLLQHTEAALDADTSRVALVVWPETALPPLPTTAAQRSLYNSLQQWTARRNITLLSGAIEPASVLTRGARTYHNAALLIHPDTVQRYRKNYLVPFAEHVPFSEYIPALRMLGVPAGGVAGYERSDRQPTLQTPAFRLGALICFESVLTHHLRAYINPQHTSRPVDFLVTVAQDGWWGASPGYRQHHAFTQLRAIAVRRAMAFVTVSGRTALIDSYGQRHASTGWMVPATRRVSIPHNTRMSIYARFGDWIGIFALLITAGFSAMFVVQFVDRKRA